MVQLYYTSPYTSGGIEKAYVVLGDFNKTKILQPNESQELTLTLDAYSMSSYDYNDANNNNFKGYELESGNYEIKLMKNAHEKEYAKNFTVNTDIKFQNDTTTENTVENRFDDVSSHITQYLSRSDFEGTWPEQPTDADRQVTAEFIKSLKYKTNDTDMPWETDEMPVQSKKILSYNNTDIKLYDLIGKNYDDQLWDELLNQLTTEQMAELIGSGSFNTGLIENIDKPKTIDPDGPPGFTVFMNDPQVHDTCFYASECVIGATWNRDIAFKMGEMVGNEGLWGYTNGDGRPYSGWYAPAVNIHRSQFGGRNWEYYSEDGFLSGIIGSYVVKGAMSKGVYTYIKHFALNDQESNRDSNGLITWANEQSMREIYFKPFEIIVKEGNTTAMMSSFNRIGTTWAGGNYALLTEVLRNEWGFNGMVITDYNVNKFMNTEQMIRAGGDLNLSQAKYPETSNASATQVAAIRRAAKNILYTVANSNAMNGMGPGVIYTYDMPYWLITLLSVTGGDKMYKKGEQKM